MEAAELDVIIKARVNEAIRGLADVQKGLANTAVQAAKVDSALQKTAKGFNSASLTISNTSRVIQDLPFSLLSGNLIAVSNNIDPLIQSFRSAVKEGGGLKGALSGIAGALTGGAGLALAFSAVTAAITYFSAKSSQASKDTNDLAKAIDSINESTARNIFDFQKLTAIATDVNQAFDVRLAAVQKLKSEYPNYLKNLSDEQILTGQLGTAYEKINNALIAKATLQAAEERLIPVIKNLVELRIKQSEAEKFLSQLSTVSEQELQNNPKLMRLYVDRKKAVDDLAKSSKEAAGVQQEVNRLMGSLTEVLRQAAPLDLNIKPEKTKGEVESIAKILEELERKLSTIRFDEQTFGISKVEEKIKAIEDAIHRLMKIDVPPDSTLIQKLVGDVDALQLERIGTDLTQKFGTLKSLKLPDVSLPVSLKPKIEPSLSIDSVKRAQLLAETEKALKSVRADIPVNLKVKSNVELKNIKEPIEAALKDINTQFENIILNFQTGVFDAVGKGIADAISGEGFGSLFKGVFTVLGEAMSQLGVALIATSIGLKALKEAFKSLNPIVAAAAGIGLIVLGNLIKNSVSKIPTFQEGGIVQGPTLGIIGERGAEAVLPLDRLKDFINFDSRPQVVVLETLIKGNDLALIQSRTERQRGRTY